MSVTLRRARPSDLACIHRLEHDPKNAPFIRPWTRRQHAEADGRRVRFVLLRGLNDREGTIEFKRNVIGVKGAGCGRAALRQIRNLAFERFGALRLQLDVKEFNPRARKLYESERFVNERGRRNGRYYSLIVMSKLRREFRP